MERLVFKPSNFAQERPSEASAGACCDEAMLAEARRLVQARGELAAETALLWRPRSFAQERAEAAADAAERLERARLAELAGLARSQGEPAAAPAFLVRPKSFAQAREELAAEAVLGGPTGLGTTRVGTRAGTELAELECAWGRHRVARPEKASRVTFTVVGSTACSTRWSEFTRGSNQR